MKYLFHKDIVFVTILCFVVMWLLHFVAINTHLFNPISEAVADFSYTDITLNTKINENAPLHPEIVVVNIDTANRKQIAETINKLSQFNPKIIGLDVYFKDPKDAYTDSILRNEINNTNIVLANKFNGEKNLLQKSYFERENTQSGYINFVGFKIIRQCSFFEEINNKRYTSFSATIFKKSYPDRFKNLEHRMSGLHYINYVRRGDKFLTIRFDSIINYPPSVYKNKIVLMGFVTNDKNSIEDKFITPVNNENNELPEMSGVYIHANILSMLLEDNLLKKTSSFIQWLLAIIFTWLCVAFFLKYFIEKHLWFHLTVKITQLSVSVLLLYVQVLFLQYFNRIIDFKYAIIGIILSVDVLYFYEGFANWLRLKFKYKTIFKQH